MIEQNGAPIEFIETHLSEEEIWSDSKPNSMLDHKHIQNECFSQSHYFYLSCLLK